MTVRPHDSSQQDKSFILTVDPSLSLLQLLLFDTDKHIFREFNFGSLEISRLSAEMEKMPVEPKMKSFLNTRGFEKPSSHLIKVNIDLRSVPTTIQGPPQSSGLQSQRSGEIVFPAGSGINPIPVGINFPPPLIVSVSHRYRVAFIP